MLAGHADDCRAGSSLFSAGGHGRVLLILTIAAKGARSLSSTALNIIQRLMGLLLAAIGVQFVLTALKLRI